MNKITRSKYVLLAVLFFCVQFITIAQTFKPINLDFGEQACDATGSDSFTIDINYEAQVFNADNEFIIELSDADGNFANPATNLKTLVSTAANNYNQAFNIVGVGFNLPSGTFGKNYRIRVRTTSPVREVISDPFEAYHDMYSNSEFGINNDMDFALCNGESKEVSLTISDVGQYLWYREAGAVDVLVGTTQDPKFTITQAGLYYVVIDYSKCGTVESRRVKAIGVPSSDAQIQGASTIEICGDEAHTFTASSNNSAYTYEWYKDNELKLSSKANTYTTPTTGQFGTYHLVVKLDDCEVKSANVELKQREAPSFTVTEEVPLLSVLLVGETRDLVISVSGVTNYRIEWYRNNNLNPISGANSLTLSGINTPGSYVAKVIDTDATGSCEASISSKPIVLLAPVSFETEIRADNYEECTSEATVLKIAGIEVKASDGEIYDLTDAQLNATPSLIRYQWKKNNANISGATNDEYSVNSYLENDMYSLTVNNSSVDSNKLDIKLFKKAEVTSTSVSNSLCPGGSITYTIDELLSGYTYEWFKDGGATAVATNEKDFSVTEVGVYTLKQTGFGCEKIVETKEVVPFDASVVVVTPSERVVLILGQSVTVTASGADSYVWYQGQGTGGAVFSTNETLDVNSLGFYTVVATVGTCTVEKEIEVVEQDDQIIVPNIVTPNQDGINDTWQISNKYAFQPGVMIQLYNSNGKEILKTTDYKNDWPTESLGNQKVFYYKIIKNDALIKAGTISVLD